MEDRRRSSIRKYRNLIGLGAISSTHRHERWCGLKVERTRSKVHGGRTIPSELTFTIIIATMIAAVFSQ
ncbi:MAG: hypothetical protein C0183_04960 [Roseiflexus castenholzii]|nr:MAG: hypothetical protein C0183_04960 [Roseiflexus castenholzii]